jgi:hypothetical protein
MRLSMQAAVVKVPVLFGDEQLTDAVLLDLAMRHEARLATFDRRVAGLALAGRESVVAIPVDGWLRSVSSADGGRGGGRSRQGSTESQPSGGDGRWRRDRRGEGREAGEDSEVAAGPRHLLGDEAGQVAAGGEAHDAEAVGVEAEVGAGAVLEDEGGDAEGVEPAGAVVAFLVDGEVAEAAAGGDEDGGAVGADEGFGLVGAVGPEGDGLGEGGGGEQEASQEGAHVGRRYHRRWAPGGRTSSEPGFGVGCPRAKSGSQAAAT